MSPFSDSNLKDMPLAEALRSPLLSTIRENAQLLGQSDGGCALWENREWVEGLASGITKAEEPTGEALRAALGS
jgi:hypothetical protein